MSKNKNPAAEGKVKLVRDSFTMPKDEYAQIDALKQRAAAQARVVKKSEILRAGIAALAQLSDAELLLALGAVPSLKTGRPKQAEPEPAPASKKVVKPAAKAATKPAPAKPAAKKLTPKPAAKATPKPAAQAAVKAVAKPATKAAAKPVAKPAAKKAATPRAAKRA